MIYQPTYFPTIESFQYLLKDDQVVFETYDNYQKQTYRTRCSVYAANGKLDLIIPVKHSKNKRQLTKDVLIEQDFDWSKNHLKSLQNAYRSSPFFEFYEDDIVALYEQQYTYLLDFLFETIQLSFKLLNANKLSFVKTSDYILEYKASTDLRHLADFKQVKTPDMTSYIQVFENKYGFIPNLSILDLLFNQGPNAVSYLL